MVIKYPVQYIEYNYHDSLQVHLTEEISHKKSLNQFTLQPTFILYQWNLQNAGFLDTTGDDVPRIEMQVIMKRNGTVIRCYCG